MVRSFNPLHHLHDGTHECGCAIVSTSFPAADIPGDPEDPDYEPFNTNHWQRIGEVGNINQLAGGLDINGAGKLKWIGSCQKHAGGIRFEATLEEVGEGQPSYASIFYACDADLDPATGYEVRVRANHDFDARENGCPFEVFYQGTSIFKRYVAGRIIIAFEHVSDADGGGVYITHYDTTDGPGHGDYFSFLHEAGPQIADDQYWGIGCDASGWLKFTTLSAAYNGNKEGGDFCQDCPPIAKETSCDCNASCGGGTLKTQPGATLIDYDGWGVEECPSNTITPYNSGGWYKLCDIVNGGSLDYAFWTFAPLSATFAFPGYGHCSGSTPLGETTAFSTWRWIRVTACTNTLTFSITMQKSRYMTLSAGINLERGCGVDVDDFNAIEPDSLDGDWPASTTESMTLVTTCSGSTSTYFRDDVCRAEDTDTITVDIENVPVGIYLVRCGVSFVPNNTPAAPSACSTRSIVAHPPVTAEFVIEGDAMTFDPICR